MKEQTKEDIKKIQHSSQEAKVYVEECCLRSDISFVVTPFNSPLIPLFITKDTDNFVLSETVGTGKEKFVSTSADFSIFSIFSILSVLSVFFWVSDGGATLAFGFAIFELFDEEGGGIIDVVLPVIIVVVVFALVGILVKVGVGVRVRVEGMEETIGVPGGLMGMDVEDVVVVLVAWRGQIKVG